MISNVVIVFLTLFQVALSFSDVGKWDIPLSGESCNFTLAKSLFKDSQLIIALNCDVKDTNITIAYSWRQTPCSPDYYHYFEKRVAQCTNYVDKSLLDNSSIHLVNVVEAHIACTGKHVFYLQDQNKNTDGKVDMSAVQARGPLLTVEREGIYELWLSVRSNKNYDVSMHIEMVSPYGYMSAAIWPLLPLFGSLCAAYAALCAAWLAACAARWRDLLRIQYWIGAVALLGMAETAAYYAVYADVNRNGYFNIPAFTFAEVVSVCKRALARMLVIIVSLGFGMVRPRLGPALSRVAGAGALWAALGGAAAWLRLQRGRGARALLLADAPVSLLDSALCWWVFVSLAHTMRTLQLRRNATKLSLYRHFTNTLIFAVIASVIFMLYSLKSYRLYFCITEWKHVWVDCAYWHVLFVAVLAAIMVLWRPTNNNQRYAFTPLLDNAEDDDDEEEEQFVNDAYGVKMRATNVSESGLAAGASHGASRGASHGASRGASLGAPSGPDADLRWVEDNIPASALPVLDSDEELLNTKFEVSKMQ